MRTLDVGTHEVPRTLGALLQPQQTAPRSSPQGVPLSGFDLQLHPENHLLLEACGFPTSSRAHHLDYNCLPRIRTSQKLGSNPRTGPVAPELCALGAARQRWKE